MGDIYHQKQNLRLFYNAVKQRGEPDVIAEIGANAVRDVVPSGEILSNATSIGLAAMCEERQRCNLATSLFPGGPDMAPVDITLAQDAKDEKQQQQ